MTTAIASPVASMPSGSARKVGQVRASRTRKKLSAFFEVKYPGAAADGEYVAEVFLTWYFGRGTTMWRERFESKEAAQAAAKEHARCLDDELPMFYWVEDWRGRPYKERHEYGISWNVVTATERTPEELVPVSLTKLPGQA